MGGKCFGIKSKKVPKKIPHALKTDLQIDPVVLYSDSRYFKPKQQLFYNNLLLEEAPFTEIKSPEE